MEVAIPNPQYRLKPGMYARVELTIEDKENALIVPKIALVDSEGRRGVYQPNEESKATFRPVTVGIENNQVAEIIEGLSEGDQVVSVGAGALRRDDTLVVAGENAPGGRQGMTGRGGRGRGGAPGSGGQEGGRQGGGGRQMMNPGQPPGSGNDAAPNPRPEGRSRGPIA